MNSIANTPQTPRPNKSLSFGIDTSRNFPGWLAEQQISLAFTTYQAGKLFFAGTQSNGRLGVFERTFNRAMGLCGNDQTLWLSTAYQLWRFENELDDIGFASDSALTSPAFIAPPNSQIQFRNLVTTQGGIDGGVFEISIGGGAFTDITFIGGSFAAGGYNAALIAGTGNPLSGRLAWTGSFTGYFDTTVNLPAAAVGQSVQVRWRLGTGSSTPAGGWAIDTIRLVSSADFADYGDAPAPYPTTLTEIGAAHLASGPTVGASRDVEFSGTHSVVANFSGPTRTV